MPLGLIEYAGNSPGDTSSGITKNTIFAAELISSYSHSLIGTPSLVIGGSDKYNESIIYMGNPGNLYL
jgi:hypothetical protein